jgi:hypothetical protein
MAQHLGLYAHGRIGSASHTGSQVVAQLMKRPGWPVRSAWPSAAQPGGLPARGGGPRCMLTGVVFPIVGGDEGGLNVEKGMRGVRKQGRLTPSLAVDGRQRGGAEQRRSVAAPD